MSDTGLSKGWWRLVPAVVLMVTGCGLTQSVTEGSRAAYSKLFYKQVKVLRLDFTAREGLNSDERESHSLSEAVVVRVYQLRERKVFDGAVYQELVREGETVLKGDLLGAGEVVVTPGGDAAVDMALDEGAKYVAVVGLFRAPEMEREGWRMVLKREELDAQRARVIELGSNRLTLRPLEEK